jgi:hypothetical protein
MSHFNFNRGFKFIIALAILILTSATESFGQRLSDKEQAMEYRVRAMKFDNMKSNGTTMIIGGGVAVVSGVLLIANANWVEDVNNPGTYTTNDDKAVYGLLAIAVGAPLTGVGIVLHTVGKKKSKRYMDRANKITLEAYGTTLGLKYVF